MNEATIAMLEIAVPVAVITGLVALACGFRRRWTGMAGSLLVLSLALVVLGRILYRVVRESANDAAWQAQQASVMRARDAAYAKHRSEILAHTSRLRNDVPSALRPTTPEEFYVCDGSPASYRVPLRFPFQIEVVDSTGCGALGAFNGLGSVNDPDLSNTELNVDGITDIAFDAHLLLLRRVPGRNSAGDAPAVWTLFNFDTATSRDYSDQQSLYHAAAIAGYAGKRDFETLQQVFEKTY